MMKHKLRIVKPLVAVYHTPNETFLSSLRFHSINLCQALCCHVLEQQSFFHQDAHSEHGYQLNVSFGSRVSQVIYTSSFQKLELISFLHLYLLQSNEFHGFNVFRFQADLYCFFNPFQNLRNSFTLSIATRYIWNFGDVHSIFVLFYQNCKLYNTALNALDISPHLNIFLISSYFSFKFIKTVNSLKQGMLRR